MRVTSRRDGEVGRMMLRKLEEEKYWRRSDRSLRFKQKCGEEAHLQRQNFGELREDSFDGGYDYALFSAGASISRHYSPIAAEKGVLVIDNSSAFRSDAEIPLVVPEINGFLVKEVQRNHCEP